MLGECMFQMHGEFAEEREAYGGKNDSHHAGAASAERAGNFVRTVVQICDRLGDLLFRFIT